MRSNDSQYHRLPSLTGLRFIAALLVFCFHASFEGLFRDAGVQGDFADGFAKAGWVGVSFFFILSGFVLAWSARAGETARTFWRRRVAKVYPNHLVTHVAAVALLLLTGSTIALRDDIPNLLLLQSWFTRPEVFLSGNPVSWSLSCEALFYLSFPLLWRLARKVRAERLWWWAGGITVAIVCVPLVAQLLPASEILPTADGKPFLLQFWFVYLLPPVRALEFALGVFMARIVRENKWIGLRLGPTLVLAVAGYLLAEVVPYLFSLVAATVVPLALLIAAAASADLSSARSPFRGRTMVWLGEISFAFYMVHRLVLVYGHYALGQQRSWDTPAAVGLLVLAAAAGLGAAWLLHTLVEQPAMRRWGKPRVRTAVEPAVAVPAVDAAQLEKVS